jgi:hypothetical protein
VSPSVVFFKWNIEIQQPAAGSIGTGKAWWRLEMTRLF